jgi:hypothetical protein
MLVLRTIACYNPLLYARRDRLRPVVLGYTSTPELCKCFSLPLSAMGKEKIMALVGALTPVASSHLVCLNLLLLRCRWQLTTTSDTKHRQVV